MKNRFILAAVLLCAAAVLGWSQFYKDYDDVTRKSLAEATWLAGKQYQAVGKTAKGAEYVEMAYHIWPGLDTSSIGDIALPSAAELLAQGGARLIAAPADEQAAARTMSSFFLRFVAALLDEDAPAAAGFLDGSVYLVKLGSEVSRPDAEEQLANLFEGVSLAGLGPSDVYDLDTLVTTKAPASLSAAWGDTWILKVNARADFSQYLPFWEKQQQFYVRSDASQRYIAAIGQGAPPAAWRPATPAPAAAAAPAASEAETAQAVRDAWTGCLTAFLSKNADAAVTFMDDDVRLLRMQQTVSREELKASFIGTFESADFGGVTLDELIDPETVFVQRTTDFESEVGGPVYLLGAKARMDLSDTIPFWTTWQGYFFHPVDGAWRMFAIR
ncbi:MAG: hypothetical protein NTU62_14200 [Spirochaetes bacterium]|nr:hypothetical protein [Spirochaetota bacterium]